MSRPNIIIFNPDEMRVDTMGHMGNQAADTPNLDAFAKTEAVSFSHAYCQNPVCVPSRCSFTTGLYPHVNGHRTMSHLMHEHETTLFRELKEAGYYVWLNGRNDLIAGHLIGLEEKHADEIFYYDKTKTPYQAPVSALERQDPGPYPYSHFQGILPMEMGADSRDVEAAIHRIEKPVGDKPFCLFVGLTNPHPPYGVEKKYYDRIKKEYLPVRAKRSETCGKSQILDEIYRYSGMEDWTEEMWQEMQTVYYAQCAYVDEQFGLLCDALKRTGQYDNSAIFVISDHGDFAGHYDLPEKAQNSFEDCLTRVPLLIKPPKGDNIDPGITDSIVELVDFYATAMDYAGVEPSHDHYGRSLRGIVADRSKTVRTYAFCEGGRKANEIWCDEFHSEGPDGPAQTNEYWARMMAQSDSAAHEKGTMITDGKFKYVQRLSGNHEFYDLIRDPLELRNLYPEQKESDIVRQMQMAILEWYQETCDIVPKEYDGRFSEERVWGILRNFTPADDEEDMRAMFRSGATLQQCIGAAVDRMLFQKVSD